MLQMLKNIKIPKQKQNVQMVTEENINSVPGITNVRATKNVRIISADRIAPQIVNVLIINFVIMENAI